jgi:hypothetical protein
MTTPSPSLLLATFALFSAACEPVLVGSSETVILNPAVETFERLSFSNEVDATVLQGSPARVEITINQNLQEELVVRSGGGQLEVGLRDGYDYHRVHLHVRVTMPAVRSVGLSGASSAQLTGFDQASVATLNVEASGASSLSGQLAADRLDVELSGASRADLDGNTRTLSLEVSGASEAVFDQLQATDVAVELSGASRATLLVDREVHGEASGASDLIVRGNGAMNVSTSGASSVSRR